MKKINGLLKVVLIVIGIMSMMMPIVNADVVVRDNTSFVMFDLGRYSFNNWRYYFNYFSNIF